MGKCKLSARGRTIYNGLDVDGAPPIDSMDGLPRFNICQHSFNQSDLNEVEWTIAPTVKFMIVVEKDAALDQLCRSAFCKSKCCMLC